MLDITELEIDRHHTSALDSVNLINSTKPIDMDGEEWLDVLNRNAEHLNIIVAREYFTDAHDMQPLYDAIELVAILNEPEYL